MGFSYKYNSYIYNKYATIYRSQVCCQVIVVLYFSNLCNKSIMHLLFILLVVIICSGCTDKHGTMYDKEYRDTYWGYKDFREANNGRIECYANSLQILRDTEEICNCQDLNNDNYVQFVR